MKKVDHKKIEAANAVLAIIAERTQIERRCSGWYVTWSRSNGDTLSRRWSVCDGSHYPPWYRHWGHGGTCTQALHQLIRWCQERPVLPLATWHYWCGQQVYLARDRGAEACSLLSDAGWPHNVPCVLCGVDLAGSIDWWGLGGVSGPCCKWGGCRQRPTESEATK